MMSEFKTYTIYRYPSDYPDSYVLKASLITESGKVEQEQVPLLIGTDPGFMREELAGRGLIRVSREPDDDPAILETWL